MPATPERTIDLPEGRALTIRRVTPGDIAGLEELYAGLAVDDLHSRFFSVYHPGRPFFERVASAPERGGYGLVAVVDDDSDHACLVAEAGYEMLNDGNAELAITVARDWRGWLGPVLLDALVSAAAARGVPNLEAEILVTNSPMLRLAWSRGAASMPADDWTTLRLMIGTAGRTPTWPRRPGGPDGRSRPRVLVETPGGRWHAGHEAAEAGLEVLACSGPRGPRFRCPVLEGLPCPLAAGADAIVVSRPPDDPRWAEVAASHAALAPGVPVCIESRPNGPATLPPGATSLPADDGHGRSADRAATVVLVDRLARRHAAARTRRQPGDGDD
jgi:hypothetical protein